MTTFLHLPDDGDGLYLCPTCADRYTIERGRPCHACREQQMIDDAEPTPFDWSVWDDDEDEGDD